MLFQTIAKIWVKAIIGVNAASQQTLLLSLAPHPIQYYNPGSTTNLAFATIKKIDEPGCNVYGLKWATKLPPFFTEEIPLTRLIGVRTDPVIFLIVAIDEIVVLSGL